MAREIKELMLQELRTRYSDVSQTGCVLVNYSGVKSQQSVDVRRMISNGGGRVAVVKNSLFALAMEELGAEALASVLAGPTAVVTAENPVAAAKAARKATEQSSGLTVYGGYADGVVLDAKGVARLADIPGRDQLLSMIAGALMAPLQRLANGLLSKPRELLSCLNQLKEQKQ